MVIRRYERPVTLDEAAALILEEGGLPLGGGVWTALNTRSVGLAVDLSRLGIDRIEDQGDAIAIGAMTTARSLELSVLLAREFGGVFASATGHIVGVQLRNVITLGGSVAGKYGFSDLVTLLLALDARLIFHNGSAIGIEEFLLAPRDKPFLLTGVTVKKGRAAAYQSLRVTANDFPVLNACASFDGEGWRLAVGSRPAAARLCPQAASHLGADPAPDPGAAGRSGAQAAEELTFGDDLRSGAEYRRTICPVLLERAILEVSR
ncbi:MAG: FAD binding domain-containing protein [Spirochaetes bacterium]|nr:FAD binding domain-containing protein [Spirochaetota bacterium]